MKKFLIILLSITLVVSCFTTVGAAKKATKKTAKKSVKKVAKKTKKVVIKKYYYYDANGGKFYSKNKKVVASKVKSKHSVKEFLKNYDVQRKKYQFTGFKLTKRNIKGEWYKALWFNVSSASGKLSLNKKERSLKVEASYNVTVGDYVLISYINKNKKNIKTNKLYLYNPETGTGIINTTFPQETKYITVTFYAQDSFDNFYKAKTVKKTL